MPLPWMHLQAGLDHLPLRAVDHDRHARDLGLAGDQVQEAHHRRLAVEHRLVHVDVDDLGAVLDLLARDAERLLELAVEDQARERLRAGDVGALADVDEQRAGADQHRLEAGQLHRQRRRSIRAAPRRRRVGCCAHHAASSSSSPNSAPRRPQRGRYLPTRSAIAAMCSGVVPQQPPAMLRKPRSRELLEQAGGDLGRLVEAGLAHRVGQAGVRIAADEGVAGDLAPAPRCRAASAPRRARSSGRPRAAARGAR